MRWIGLTLAGAAVVLSACSASSESGSTSESDSEPGSAGGSPDAFIQAIDKAQVAVLLGRSPSDSELLDAGEQFCDRWQAAIDDPNRMDGPLFVRQELDRELSQEGRILLEAVFFPAEDHLCPELMS